MQKNWAGLFVGWFVAFKRLFRSLWRIRVLTGFCSNYLIVFILSEAGW
jgi:hypothetical protein